jgi:hypothetical protein
VTSWSFASIEYERDGPSKLPFAPFAFAAEIAARS